MSTQITGSVRMAGDTGRGVEVVIHLEEETLTLAAEGGAEIGTWPLAVVGISSRPDGFHLRIEGEEAVLTTSDDAGFALAMGINTPTGRLARQMAVLRDQAAARVTVDLTDPPPAYTVEALTTRRQSRLATGLPYLGLLVILAAFVAFASSIMAALGGTALSFPGDLPAWPAMSLSSLVLAAGGYSAFQRPSQGRVTIGVAIAIGLIVILFTAGRLEPVGVVEEALLSFTLAVVASGVLLAVDTAGRADPD